MDMRVHRLVTDRKTGDRHSLQCHRIRIARDDLTFPRKPFEIPAIFRIVRVLIHPVEGSLCEHERSWFFRCLGCGRSAVKAKAYSVEVLAIRVKGRDLALVVQSPVKTAVLLIPQSALEECKPVAGNGQELVL